MTAGGGGGGGSDPSAYGKAAGYSEDYGAPQAETSFQPEPGMHIQMNPPMRFANIFSTKCNPKHLQMRPTTAPPARLLTAQRMGSSRRAPSTRSRRSSTRQTPPTRSPNKKD